MPALTTSKQSRKNDLRVRLTPELKQEVDALFERKNISQVKAVTAMLKWVVEQPDLVQSVVLGQIDDESAISVLRHVLNKMESRASPRKPRRRA